MFHRVFQPAQLSTAVPWSPAHPRTFTIPTDRLQDPAAAGQDSPCLCPTVHSLFMQTLPKAFATQKALKCGVRRPDSSQMCMGLPSQSRALGWSAYICLHLRDTGESLPGTSKSPLCLVAVPQAHWTHLPATSQHSPPWLVPPPTSPSQGKSFRVSARLQM